LEFLPFIWKGKKYPEYPVNPVSSKLICIYAQLFMPLSIDWLSDNFEKVTPEPLIGQFKGTFKLRIGDWRVVCTIEGQTLVIQFIGHRRNIYSIL